MNRDLQALKLMEAAFDLPVEEQSAFVEQACEGDSALLRKVRSLLEAADDHVDFLATRAAESPSESTPAAHPKRIGSYEILREIGRGGMGVVYEAEHDAMKRRVALKVLSTGSSPSQTQLARFYREARAAGKLHHSNIVPVFEVGSADGIHYYTMQFINGSNLDLVIDEVKAIRGKRPLDPTEHFSQTVAARLVSADSTEKPSQRETDETPELIARDLNKRSNSDGRKRKKSDTSGSGSVFADSEWSTISGKGAFYRRVAAIGLQVADAMDYAHQHDVLHRDIKPANLILDTVGVVWVLDFGLAKSNEDDLTLTGDVVGTLRYMAPERFDGKADIRSDIYSLGLTLYELCTQQHAFDATDRATLLKQVTTQLSLIHI